MASHLGLCHRRVQRSECRDHARLAVGPDRAPDAGPVTRVAATELNDDFLLGGLVVRALAEVPIDSVSEEVVDDSGQLGGPFD